MITGSNYPAYPSNELDYTNDKIQMQHHGLTKREVFAMAAMQSDWASQSPGRREFDLNSSDNILRKYALLYFRMADAMLRAGAEAS